MTKEFLVASKKSYSYSDLINDINREINYSRYLYVKENKPYELFLKILHSILYHYPIEMLDGNFSKEELAKIGIDIAEVFEKKYINGKIKIKSIKNILDEAKKNKNWTITLYTSGTTGLPKKVVHTIDSITRNVKISDKFCNNIWGLAYNPTHIAGLQVFFQAIFNENTMVDMFANEIKNAKENIEKYQVTNISATSTYYRNLLMHLKENMYESVNYITFGGEKYDKKVMEQIGKVFPKAKIRNIYASTEAGSLFNSKGEVFTIPDKLKNMVKISKENELLIHKSLLGDLETMFLDRDWYNTKDIVEKTCKNSFKIVSRKTDLINVGGYNVNPLEIEEILLNIPEIVDIKAYGRKNSVTGNIIMIDIVITDKENEKEIRQRIKKYASKNLQPWKVPRIINIVDKLEQTRTGKKARK